MRLICWLLIMSMCLPAAGQNNTNIIPAPVEVTMGKGQFKLDRNTLIIVDNNRLERSVHFLNDYLYRYYGFRLNRGIISTGSFSINLNISGGESKKDGGYSLTIAKNGVTISGNDETGVFYGIQSLIQLIPPENDLYLPFLTIHDEPRFSYRGMHLDVGRHLFPLNFIKKYIDYLALHKYNTFHWHLTEDQGWRIEIKQYPLLTKVGSCRERTLKGRYGSNVYDNVKYCGFYSQKEVKEIVQYAANRYITVIPEIEMPGHSTAALASYPFLGCTKGLYKVMDTWGVLDDVYCAGNDSTFIFLQNVLDEVMQLFPSKYIHIGGDECPKERWKTCPLCQKRIREEHLKDEHALQSYFIQRIEKYLNSKGRQIIGWDEILEGGLAPNATVMSWRGEEGGIAAAKQGHDVVMTPGSHCYLDHSQSKNEDSLTIGGFLPLETVYSYEPIPKELTPEQAKHVLGAQGNVWTEYMDNPSKVEYMIFPRMSALSEVLWSPAASRNWNDFERRLPVLFKRYLLWGANNSKAYFDPSVIINATGDYDGIEIKVNSKKEKPLFYFGNKTKSQFMVYPDSIQAVIKTTGIYGIRLLGKFDPDQKGEEWGLAISSPFEYLFKTDIRFSFNKATGKKITLVTLPNKSYPGNGSFTLVDGVQNEKGLARSSEFLGFLGKDLDATIDLKALTDIKKVTLHVLDQNGSWIYLPSQVEVTYLPDTAITDEIIKSAPKATKIIDAVKDKGSKTIVIESKQHCRYIHIIARNYGTIPSGHPGAGNPAWLFADEIEVD